MGKFGMMVGAATAIAMVVLLPTQIPPPNELRTMMAPMDFGWAKQSYLILLPLAAGVGAWMGHEIQKRLASD